MQESERARVREIERVCARALIVFVYFSRLAAASCSVIIKRQIASLSRRQLYRCEEAFSNEINVYRHVVPLLCRYSQQPLFPKCHIAETDDGSPNGEAIIVLQDLKASEFRMQNRLAGLELRHCLLVMKVPYLIPEYSCTSFNFRKSSTETRADARSFTGCTATGTRSLCRAMRAYERNRLLPRGGGFLFPHTGHIRAAGSGQFERL